MNNERQIKGKFGEELAVKHLEALGMVLLEKNFRFKTGEIDLIFRDKDTLVFVEVKLRQTSYFGGPFLAVDKKKQRKIINTVKYYIQKNHLKNPFIRFDIACIEYKDNSWVCTHYRHAFLER